MKSRCKDKKNKHYGLKGIKVCKEWNDFSNFYQDMYASYLNHCEKYGADRKGTSIDRIDGNKEYSRNNCRWATSVEQRNNISIKLQ
jgi:hypothetical protein